MVQFDLPTSCSRGLKKKLKGRWAEARVPDAALGGASERCWVFPEEVAMAPFGAFAFRVGTDTPLFPVAASG